MVHGYPDWGIQRNINIIYHVPDPGEAAARQVWLDTYDRRGFIIWADDFEDGALKWEAYGTGTGYAAAISQTRAWRGADSVMCTTGNAAGDRGGIFKSMYYPKSTRWGVEGKFWFTWNTRCMYINITEHVGDTTRYGYILRYHFKNETIDAYNVGGTYTTLKSNCKTYANWEYWLPIKLVVETGTHTYVRGLVGEWEVDLTGVTPWTDALGGTSRYYYAGLYFETNLNASQEDFLDDVIITQEEY